MCRAYLRHVVFYCAPCSLGFDECLRDQGRYHRLFCGYHRKKKIQEKIYNDGQNLRAIINNTLGLIWPVDTQSHIITGNQAFWDRVKELTGKDKEEVTNADFLQERMKVFFESYERAFKSEAFSIVRQRELDGRLVYEDLSFNPIHDQRDEVIGVNDSPNAETIPMVKKRRKTWTR